MWEQGKIVPSSQKENIIKITVFTVITYALQNLSTKNFFSQFFLNTKCILWDVIFNVHIALKNKPFYMKIII